MLRSFSQLSAQLMLCWTDCRTDPELAGAGRETFPEKLEVDINLC